MFIGEGKKLGEGYIILVSYYCEIYNSLCLKKYSL